MWHRERESEIKQKKSDRNRDRNSERDSEIEKEQNREKVSEKGRNKREIGVNIQDNCISQKKKREKKTLRKLNRTTRVFICLRSD